MTFIPIDDYRHPASIDFLPGEPAVIQATTLHVVRNERGSELGYLLEPGPGEQGSR
ncbi:hypothetical protein [Microbacterium sp.]|uniref:hypothetical protein n=1 Tax=Microbacterium sp. TaxID=51671 RepID=UPI002811C83D|nr:hypothetical protein [Microbacterium sp.]